MKRLVLPFQLLLLVNLCLAQLPATPDKVYGVLFEDVQRSKIFPDGKTFVDCIPKKDPKQIVADYLALKNNPAVRYSLKLFVENNFVLPRETNVEVPKNEDVKKHIESLWQILRRDPDKQIEGSSLLPLPYPYIVPGGRFREIYYWDSYFTMLGLRESGQEEMIENMIKNFAYLINKYGFIPNGNRTYYLGRSQPPYFALMVELLAEKKGNVTYALYLDALQTEHNYYMDKTAATKHVVKMPDGSMLNRYYDRLDIPRQESFIADEEVAAKSKQNKATIYRHLRSAAESGWDFSSRWFKDSKNLATIQVTNYVPVDLNCLLYQLEITLSKAYKERGNLVRQRYYEQIADKRKRSILKYCWSTASGAFMDWDITTKKTSPELTIATAMPLFMKVATHAQAKSVMNVIKSKFLQPGGVVTTLRNTGEQWDAPNGWAPLLWLTVQGLRNYDFMELAQTISQRWIKLNVDVYNRTGKLMEKYDVMNINLDAGGGEYPSQDGFGWTNGVLLKLISLYGMPNSFPVSWQGNWKGELAWHRITTDTPQMVKMQLRIQPADSAGHYTWHLVYGEGNKDSRPYILKPVDKTKGHWVIDELNGILLDQYYFANRLSCTFTVANSTIVNHYWLEGDKLIAEFYNITAKPVSTTGKGTDESPTVSSYGVRGYQRAELKRGD